MCDTAADTELDSDIDTDTDRRHRHIATRCNTLQQHSANTDMDVVTETHTGYRYELTLLQTLQHALQHTLQHALQHTLQRTLQHAQQHSHTTDGSCKSARCHG